MNTLYQSFFSSILWNSVESVVYYGLFFIHQMFLFTHMQSSEYGKVSAVFAGVYFLVSFVDCGFESTLALFLPNLTASKSSLKSFMIRNSIPSFFLIVVLIVGGFYLPISIDAPLPTFFFVLLIVSEYIRKMIKSFLQLLFYHQITTIAEMTMLIIYLTTVWTAYFLGYSLSFNVLFIPLFTLSLCNVIILFCTTYTKIYVPLNDTSPKTLPHYNIINVRIFAFANTMASQLFSSNFLVPFLAIHTNLDQAATFKLLSSFIHTFSVGINKIFGISGRTLLAHSLTQNNTATAFSLLNAITHKVITYATVGCALMVFCTLQSTSWLPLLAWYATISLIETITIAHDKLYPINHAIGILCSINICTILSMIVIMKISSISLSSLLTATLILKLLASITVIGIARYRWHAPAPWNTGIICTISTSLAIYCIFSQLP